MVVYEESDEGEAQPARKPMSRFMRDADSESESEEETPKIIKSAKDKRYDELEATITTINNGQKINDWGSISTGSWTTPPPPVCLGAIASANMCR